jgi:hypothetical protein
VAIGGVLLIAAMFSVVRMPRYREILDTPPARLEAFQAVRANVPEHETVLSLTTYDTFYYSGRPATWPIAWGQKDHPVEMFLTSDSDSVLAAFERHRLRYLLISRRPRGETFDGANFPRPFLNCVARLVEQGRMEVLWTSPTLALVGVRRP